MENKIEFEGIIKEDWESWGELCIGDKYLTSESSFLDGNFVKLKYYISETPINKENAEEKFLKSYYSGLVYTDTDYCYGSEWTGVYAKNDHLDLGEHNIINELSDYIGKYCYLVIEKEENGK